MLKRLIKWCHNVINIGTLTLCTNLDSIYLNAVLRGERQGREDHSWMFGYRRD